MRPCACKPTCATCCQKHSVYWYSSKAALCTLALCKATVTLLLDELHFKCDTIVYCSCPQLTPSHLHGILAFSWDQVSSSSASMRSMQPLLTSDLCNDKLVNCLLLLLLHCLSCLPTHATALQSCISHRSSYPIKALPSQPWLLLNIAYMMHMYIFVTATNVYTVAALCRIL